MTARMMTWLLARIGAAPGGRARWLGAGMLWVVVTGPLTVRRLPWFFYLSDVDSYLKLARGDHNVMQPFASRQLTPLLVRALTALSGMPVETAFIALGSVTYVVFAATVLALVVRDETPRWVALMILGMAFWGFSLEALALPDLLFSALTGIFLLLLRRRWDVAAALMLFPLTLSREATMLTLFCLLLAGWGRMRASRLVLAVAALALGTSTVKHLAAGALGNAQNMPPSLYLIGKLPWNAARNVFGLDLFTNLAPCAGSPLWQHAFSLHALTVIGICQVDPSGPLMELRALTACFGILPVLLPFAWKRRRTRFAEMDVLLRFCLLYGVISFVLAPGLGTAVDRLVRYAWPGFLVGVPLLLTPNRTGLRGDDAAKPIAAAAERPHNWLRPQTIALLLMLHLAASWAEFVAYTPRTLYVSIPAMLAAWWLLRRDARRDEPSLTGAGQLASAA